MYQYMANFDSLCMISNIQTHLKSTLLIPFFEIKSIGSNANLRKNCLSLFLFRARSPSIYHSLSIFIYTLFTYKPWDAKAAIGNHPPKVEYELRDVPRLRNPLSFVSTTGSLHKKTS